VVALSQPVNKPTKQQQLWISLVAARAVAAKVQRMQTNSSQPMLALSRAFRQLQTFAASLDNTSAQQWVCTHDKSITGAVEASSECVAGVQLVSWSNLASKQSRACQLEFAIHSMGVYATALRDYSNQVLKCDPLPAGGHDPAAFKNSTTAAVDSFASSAADIKQLFAHRTELLHSELTKVRKQLHTAEKLALQTKSSAAKFVGRVPGAAKGLVKAQEKASEVLGLLHELTRKVNDMDTPNAVSTLHESVDQCAADFETRTAERHASEALWERARNRVDQLQDLAWKGRAPDSKFDRASEQQREITQLFRDKLQLSRAQVELAALRKNNAKQQSAQLILEELQLVERSALELQQGVPLAARLSVAAAARSKVEAAGLHGVVAQVTQNSKSIEVAIREGAVQKQALAERTQSRNIAKAKQRQEIIQKQQIVQMKADIVVAKKAAAMRAEREGAMRKKVTKTLATMKKVSGIKIDIGYNYEAERLDHRQTRIIRNSTRETHESMQVQLSNKLNDMMSLRHEMHSMFAASNNSTQLSPENA